MAMNVPTIDDVTLAALDVFENYLYAAKCCSRDVQDSFGIKGAQIGDAVRIRKPAEFAIRTGQGWAGEDIEEQTPISALGVVLGFIF